VAAELALLHAAARAALAMDEGLRSMRFQLVPSRVKEGEFWHNYFMRVLRERQIFQLGPLVAPSNPPHGQGDHHKAPSGGVPTALGGPDAGSSAFTGARATEPASAVVAEARGADLHSTELQEAEAEAEAWLQLANAAPKATPATQRPRPTPASMLLPPTASGSTPSHSGSIAATAELKASEPSTTKAAPTASGATEAGAQAVGTTAASTVSEGAGSSAKAGSAPGVAPTASAGNELGAVATTVATAAAAGGSSLLAADSAPAAESSTASEQDCTPAELEAKIAAELMMDDDDDDDGDEVNLEVVYADDDLDAVLGDDDDDL